MSNYALLVHMNVFCYPLLHREAGLARLFRQKALAIAYVRMYVTKVMNRGMCYDITCHGVSPVAVDEVKK